MPIVGKGENPSGEADRIVATLRMHTDRMRRLVQDIEDDTLSPVALKHRIGEIESGLKKLREVI